MKEQIKAPEKNTTKGQRNSQPIRFRVQNTGNQDVHKNDWIWSQNRGKNEGYKNWNKGKCSGNQQWQEGNQDSNQWFGPEGRNEHLTGREWRNKNSKKWGEAYESPGQL